MTRRRVFALAVLAAGLAACREPDPGSGDPVAEPVGDVGERAPPEVRSPADHVPDGGLIDPATVEVGDSILGLRVAATQLSRATAVDSSVWTGFVDFDGEIELAGVYQPHFDYPEPSELCFHPDSSSAGRIPAFRPDASTAPGRKRWFCFVNSDLARESLGPPDRPREARVMVRGYRVLRSLTDGWDTAELVRVVGVGPLRTRTLREPPAQPRLVGDSVR